MTGDSAEEMEVAEKGETEAGQAVVAAVEEDEVVAAKGERVEAAEKGE